MRKILLLVVSAGLMFLASYDVFVNDEPVEQSYKDYIKWKIEKKKKCKTYIRFSG